MTIYTDIISPDTLQRLLNEPQNQPVKFIDGSYALAHMNIDPRQKYKARHIPGAHFFDIDQISAPDTDLPHMLPDAATFENAVRAMGINNDDQIVVYHNEGIPYACARVWWMFRVFGHERVCVLDGGLAAWMKTGGAISEDSTEENTATGNFIAHFQPSLLKSKADIYAALDSPSEHIIDARSAPRFNGEEPEPRAGLKSGHMPGALNIPFTNLIETETGRFKTKAALEEIFAPLSAAPNIIASCGSGVTASILALGLHIIGRTAVGVYDGSWAEWGCIQDDNPCVPL